VEQTWSIAPGEGPSGLALDNETHRLFSATNKLNGGVWTRKQARSHYNSSYGEVVWMGQALIRTETGLQFLWRRLTYSVQEENKNSFKVWQMFRPQAGARTISVSAKTHRIYLQTENMDLHRRNNR